MHKNKNKTYSLERMLSVNALLAIVIILEILVAIYLISGQNVSLQNFYRRNENRSATASGTLKGSDAMLPTTGEKSTVSASLKLVAVSSHYSVGKRGDVDLVLAMSDKETVSAIEGRILYDPQKIRIDGITTRGLFDKVPDKNDSSAGVFSFVLYSQDGQLISDELNLATIGITPLRPGNASLTLLLDKNGDNANTSTVIRFDEPANLLQTVNKLDISIK